MAGAAVCGRGNNRRPEQQPAGCERTCGRKSSAPPVKRPAAGNVTDNLRQKTCGRQSSGLLLPGRLSLLAFFPAFVVFSGLRAMVTLCAPIQGHRPFPSFPSCQCPLAGGEFCPHSGAQVFSGLRCFFRLQGRWGASSHFGPEEVQGAGCGRSPERPCTKAAGLLRQQFAIKEKYHESAFRRCRRAEEDTGV